MNIPQEAVEAGAIALDKFWGGRYAPNEVEELSDEVRAILEAAAQHLMAEAWDEGFITAEDEARYHHKSPNPYRKDAK